MGEKEGENPCLHVEKLKQTCEEVTCSRPLCRSVAELGLLRFSALATGHFCLLVSIAQVQRLPMKC